MPESSFSGWIMDKQKMVSKRTILRMWGNRNKEFKTVQDLLVFERGKEKGFLSNENFKRKSKSKNIISVLPFSTIYIWFCTCFIGEM